MVRSCSLLKVRILFERCLVILPKLCIIVNPCPINYLNLFSSGNLWFRGCPLLKVRILSERRLAILSKIPDPVNPILYLLALYLICLFSFDFICKFSPIPASSWCGILLLIFHFSFRYLAIRSAYTLSGKSHEEMMQTQTTSNSSSNQVCCSMSK